MTPSGTNRTPSERPSQWRPTLLLLVAVVVFVVIVATASCGPNLTVPLGSYDDGHAVTRVFVATQLTAGEGVP